MLSLQSDLIGLQAAAVGNGGQRVAAFLKVQLWETDPSDRCVVVVDKSGTVIAKKGGVPEKGPIGRAQMSPDGRRLGVVAYSGDEVETFEIPAAGGAGQ